MRLPHYQHFEAVFLMKIPVPVFRKFCRAIIVILVLIFLLHIGSIEEVFADWPGECTKVLKSTGPKKYIAIGDAANMYTGVTVDMNKGELHWEGYLYRVGPYSYNFIKINLWYYQEGRNWSRVISETEPVIGGEAPGIEVPDSDVVPTGNCEVCVTEKAELKNKCGGADKVDWTTWNDETCTGGGCKLDQKNNQGPPCEPGQCCQ
jgi:hypothetical protein